MTVSERIRVFVRYKKISISEFCRTLEVSSAYVSSMQQSMSLKMLQRISLIYPELNILWLQTGEGEMLKPAEEDVELILDASHPPCRECDRKDGKIEALMETVRDLQDRLNKMSGLYYSVAGCHSKSDKD